MATEVKEVTITLVGDAVGKSCLLISYIENTFPKYSNVPTIFETLGRSITVNGQTYSLTIYDTSDHEDCGRLRTLSYQKATCFLICYSISDRTSYENVTKLWIPEIRRSNSETPIVLVATKIDLRTDSNQETITRKEGINLMQQVKANSYIECSAKNSINVAEVFKEAVRVNVQKRASRKFSSCVLQ